MVSFRILNYDFVNHWINKIANIRLFFKKIIINYKITFSFDKITIKYHQ